MSFLRATTKSGESVTVNLKAGTTSKQATRTARTLKASGAKTVQICETGKPLRWI